MPDEVVLRYRGKPRPARFPQSQATASRYSLAQSEMMWVRLHHFALRSIGFLYCSMALLTRFASFSKSLASGWDRALSKFSIMVSMLGMWSGCSFIFT